MESCGTHSKGASYGTRSRKGSLNKLYIKAPILSGISINQQLLLFLTQEKMRFFTSISIAALCFVASIQAAPQGSPGLPAVLGDVPVVGQAVAQQPPGQALDTGAAQQQSDSIGSITGVTRVLTG